MIDDSESLPDRMEAELEFRTGDPQVGPLWHYTNEAGLHGILTSRHIRATAFQGLNDRTEITLGQELVQEAAESLRRSSTGAPSGLWESFLRQYENQRLTDMARVFVFSLCEEGDALTMWRAYGGGAAGYAIGFDSLPFENLEAAPGAALAGVVVRMRYDRAALAAHFAEVLGAMGQGIHRWCSGNRERADVLWSRGCNILLRRAASLTITAKHHGFADEREWRVLAIALPGAEAQGLIHQPNRTGRPYVALPLTEGGATLLPLRGIRLGPLAAAGQGEELVKLLRALGYSNPQSLVLDSEVPLR
jgi:hypothetical protein